MSSDLTSSSTSEPTEPVSTTTTSSSASTNGDEIYDDSDDDSMEDTIDPATTSSSSTTTPARQTRTTKPSSPARRTTPTKAAAPKSGGSKLWSEEETATFINILETLKPLHNSEWEKVSQALAKSRYFRTAEACRKRWTRLSVKTNGQFSDEVGIAANGINLRQAKEQSSATNRSKRSKPKADTAADIDLTAESSEEPSDDSESENATEDEDIPAEQVLETDEKADVEEEEENNNSAKRIQHRKKFKPAPPTRSTRSNNNKRKPESTIEDLSLAAATQQEGESEIRRLRQCVESLENKIDSLEKKIDSIKKNNPTEPMADILDRIYTKQAESIERVFMKYTDGMQYFIHTYYNAPTRVAAQPATTYPVSSSYPQPNTPHYVNFSTPQPTQAFLPSRTPSN